MALVPLPTQPKFPPPYTLFPITALSLIITCVESTLPAPLFAYVEFPFPAPKTHPGSTSYILEGCKLLPPICASPPIYTSVLQLFIVPSPLPPLYPFDPPTYTISN